MGRNTYFVATGHQITVAPLDAPVQARRVDDSTVGAVVRYSHTFGPYLGDCEFVVDGPATVTVSASALSMSIASLVSSGAGAPVDALRAAANINPTGNENGLTFTAKAYGAEGNLIGVTYVDPAANNASLAVNVSGTSIAVSLATGVAGAITSTAAQVLAAINAEPKAAELVTPTIYAADGGGVDDGSGIVTAMSRTDLADGAGTGIGTALAGSLYIDTTNAFVYRNSGTQAAPAWTKLGDAA